VGVAAVALEAAAKKDGWSLSAVPFLINGLVGKMLLDTGAGVSAVTASLVRDANLKVTPHGGGPRYLRVASGERLESPGTVDMKFMIQLMIDVGDTGSAPQFMHWDRQITLKKVWVMPEGATPSPTHLFVAYRDWKFDARSGMPPAPLASLAYLVLHGATLLASPRVPKSLGVSVPDVRVVIERHFPATEETMGVSAVDAAVERQTLRERILERVPAALKDSEAATTLIKELEKRAKLFTPLTPADCTEVVDFELIGDPVPVSFRVPISRKAHEAAAFEGLLDWQARGICERVPWDTPAYGFVILVPKANGKFRVTINPANVNAVTKRYDPRGGYMPSSMLREALRVGRQQMAHTADMAEAFLTMKLGPTAQRLSTFTTPLGKMRWKQGYFGYHSFPAHFQRIIMEKVVLPTLDEISAATILAWIDDLVVAAPNAPTATQALLGVMDRILAIGGRLNLEKCGFFVQQFDWCGIEVDLSVSRWRVARRRVESLLSIPDPKDREALSHVLGVLRYYYFGVSDQKGQRDRISELAELDKSGTVLAKAWTVHHSQLLRKCIDAVVNGAWIMVYDPSHPVYVTTDAGGKTGYAVIVYQFDPLTGEPLPIAYYSKGWVGPQIHWMPQVKECYAQRMAVCVYMPEAFPFADVILLTDNMNLAWVAESTDHRVLRWQFDIECAPCFQRGWVPGDWNAIADYGSRSVVPDPTGKLTAEQQLELHIYAFKNEGGALPVVSSSSEQPIKAITVDQSTESNGRATTTSDAEASSGSSSSTDDSTGSGQTLVPGHLPMAPLAAKIAMAQAMAPQEEKDTWTGRHHTSVLLGGCRMFFYKHRLIVPSNARELKEVLMRLAHDDNAHYSGADRTLRCLVTQAKVHWVGMDAEVYKYVASCFRCQFAKANRREDAAGTLTPTLAPYVNHTWYADLKGPMPFDTGYILVIVEAITRLVRLRYVPSNTAKEICEELTEAFISSATRPVVLRSDGGPPFDSAEYRKFMAAEGVTPVIGLPYHSQGQGLVETRIRGVAAALMATLGAKAPRTWFEGHLLARIEDSINSTYVSSIGMTPAMAMYGRESRTALAAACDWSSPDFGATTFGLPSLTLEEINEIIAAHHAVLDAVHSRAMLATSVEQAVTKGLWDSSHPQPTFKIGEWVLVRVAAPNRMAPWMTGPYCITAVEQEGNVVRGRHFVDNSLAGPFHVSRLQRIDMSRATREEVTSHQLESGSAVVADVLGHRVLATGALEFEIRWFGTGGMTSWVPSAGVRQVTKVINYCTAMGLPKPGTEVIKSVKPQAAAANSRSGRLKGRGGKN